jgi:hypothetical protein
MERIAKSKIQMTLFPCHCQERGDEAISEGLVGIEIARPSTHGADDYSSRNDKRQKRSGFGI